MFAHAGEIGKCVRVLPPLLDKCKVQEMSKILSLATKICLIKD